MSKKWKFANEVNIGKVGSGNCQRNEKERWLKTFRLWHSFYLWPVCHSESSSIEASAEGSRLIGHRLLVVSASVFRHLNIVFFVCQISHFIVHLLQFFIDLWLCKNKYCYQKVFAFSDPAPSLPQVLLQQLERGHLRSSQQVGHKLCCQKSCSLRKICTDVITQASQIGNINLPFFFKHQTQIAFLSIHLFCCFWEHVHFIKIDSLISRQEQKNQLKVGVLYFYFTYTGKNPFHGVENCRLFLVSPDLLPLNICKRTFDSVFLNLLWKQSLSTNLT